MALRTHKNRFIAIEVIVVIVVVLIGIALLLPMLGAGHRAPRQLMNSTQLRGIQQAMVTYAQSNKLGGQDGYFPGLDASGRVLPDSEATGFSGDGTQPAARLAIMLNENAFVPEYLINHADDRAIEAELGRGESKYQGLTTEHYSYAMLGIAEALNQDEYGRFASGDDTRASEWKETLNTSAPVLSDRAIGTGPDDLSSVWTEPGSGEWHGGITRNDNSTSFENSPIVEHTRFGDAPGNDLDHLFEDAPDASDAFLVFEDATTAYSVD